MKNEIWIYGINSIRSAVNSVPRNIREIRFAPTDRNRRIQQLLAKAQSVGIDCKVMEVAAINRQVGNLAHQNIIALFELPDYLGERDIYRFCESKVDPVFFILDRISDPRNFGACLRIAESCGVTAVIIPTDHAVKLTPAVVKTASGAVGRIPIIKVPNLVRVINSLKEVGIWIVGATSESSTLYTEINYCRPTALVLGAEGKGLRRLTEKACDSLVAIPMYGEIESLNISSAGAVLLYELCRQRSLYSLGLSVKT